MTPSRPKATRTPSPQAAGSAVGARSPRRGRAKPAGHAGKAGKAAAAESVPPAELGAPRAPHQSRGQKRVEEILDAAEAVIAEVGVEGATTNAIAERAGSSVGSLYHFFPSRDAIIQALARRFQAYASHSNAQAMPPDAITLSLEQLFERIVTAQVQLVEKHPAFQMVHDAVCHDPRALADFQAMRSAIIGQVEWFLAARYPHMPKRDRQPVARLAVIVVQHTLDEAQLLPVELQPAMLRELQRMLVRYFEPLDAKYGVPAPRR